MCTRPEPDSVSIQNTNKYAAITDQLNFVLEQKYGELWKGHNDCVLLNCMTHDNKPSQ